MIKPSVGRIVHFFPAGHPAGEDPHAAMVVGVKDDRTINLAIFDREGHQYHGTDVMLLQDADKPPADRGYAAWMAYQVGQAAKTEALQAQLAGAGQQPAAQPAPASANPQPAPTPAPQPAPAP